MCRDLKSTKEVQDWLSSAYSNLAMVDYPYSASNFRVDEKDNSRKESSRQSEFGIKTVFCDYTTVS